MKRPVFNILIEACSLVIFAAMISTGLILKFVLPPGTGHWEKLGLSRHEWGDIHFYIAIAFLTILIIHVVLHWGWITAMTFGTAGCPQPRSRKIMTVVVIFCMLLSLMLPWLYAQVASTKTAF